MQDKHGVDGVSLFKVACTVEEIGHLRSSRPAGNGVMENESRILCEQGEDKAIGWIGVFHGMGTVYENEAVLLPKMGEGG